MSYAAPAAIVILVIIAVFLFFYPEPLFQPPASRAPVSPSTPASLVVGHQELDGGRMFIEKAFFDRPGFIVVHADLNGSPGEVIGNSEVLEGNNENVLLGIDTSRSGPQVHVMLHYDDDSDGNYDFPETDNPVFVEGEILSRPVTLFPFLKAADHPLNDSQVLASSLYLDMPGFVVVHADLDGSPGEVIGHSGLLSGYQENAWVDADEALAGSIVHVMLHYDDDNDGEYGFPDEDAPVLVEGEILTIPVSIG